MHGGIHPGRRENQASPYCRSTLEAWCLADGLAENRGRAACVSMTESATFFARSARVGRPNAQAAAALQDCQKRQTGADLGWGLSG